MPDVWAGGMADIDKISRKRELITPRCYDLPFKIIEKVRSNMNINECLRIIYESSDLYKKNLLGKNILLLYQQSPNNVKVMETIFTETSYLHLTGICFTKGNEMSPADFFTSCIDRRLSVESITDKADGTTEQKLEILPLLLTPNLSAKMIGKYRGGRIKLVTDRLAGGLTGSVGFIEDSGRYYPNTILKGDIRDNIEKPLRVLAVFRKNIADDRYEECTYLAKKVDLKKLAIPEPYRYLSEM